MKSEPDRFEPLWVSDDELIRRMNVSYRRGRALLEEHDRNPRFPRKQPAYDNKRFYPAVVDFFYEANRVKSRSGAARLIPERPAIRTGLPRRSPLADNPLRKGTSP